MPYDIKEIFDLCLENNVNIELFHGRNTSGKWRATALIELDETIHVDFGDKDHGQRISRIHVAHNHKVIVKEAELISAVTAYQSESRWSSSSIKRPEQRLPIAYVASNKGVEFEGKIVHVNENPYVANGEIYTAFIVEVRSWFLINNEINERAVAQTAVRFSANYDDANIEVGKQVNVSGSYIPSFGIDATEVIAS